MDIVRGILKDKYNNQQFFMTELNKLITDILEDTGLSEIIVVTCMSEYIYLHRKNNKYYFGLKRNTQQNREKYLGMLKNIINIDQTCTDLSELDLKDEFDNIDDEFEYPVQKDLVIIKKTSPDFGPYGTQNIHDIQNDDEWDFIHFKRSDQFKKLRNIKLPEQRSKEWFAMRDGAITASDGGCVLDVNKYEPPYKFIIKKCIGAPFNSNEFCYHGKKLEEIATMIYAYRMNVTVEEFGLMMHPTYSFLGASPDGICNNYKHDGIHRSKYVGRMLEIKCPFVRKINKTGNICGDICPIYYWVQVQLQLECCDLEECDFWQCILREYKDRDEFIADTNPTEYFLSKKYKYEKGCLIQLVPKNKMTDIMNGKYLDVVYDSAIFIYPPKIEMSPYDCDIWIAQTIGDISTNKKYENYVFDKVIYWRLEDSFNVTVMRDRDWFNDKLIIFKKMWGYVRFLRNNKEQLDLFKKYLDSCNIKSEVKKNKIIMDIIEKLCDYTNPDYQNIIENIKEELENNNFNDNESSELNLDEFSFI
jgi:putative phage-type endonuclease